MWKKTLLASLIALTGSAGLAHGQYGLGTPLAPESTRDPAYHPVAPIGPPVESRVDVSPRVQRPLLGNLARAMLKPIRAAAGHLSPPQPYVEPTPTKDDIARMIATGSFSSAEITAAKIKLDETQAKARQAAVRYLATADCNYYPEAESGLIMALRADRSESVRHEAAVALGTCRGTTKKIVEALSLTALGQESDGNPSESSERVRLAARTSLNRVLANGMALHPMDQPPLMPVAMEGFDPYALEPAGYAMPSFPFPTPMYSFAPLPTPSFAAPPMPLPAPTVSPRERELAETVSVHATSVTAPTVPRTVVEWIHHFTASREAPRNATPARKPADPRLRGLAPLGSESRLAITATYSTPAVYPVPAAYVVPTSFPYSLPYNDE